jgi:hypothetical protein
VAGWRSRNHNRMGKNLCNDSSGTSFIFIFFTIVFVIFFQFNFIFVKFIFVIGIFVKLQFCKLFVN